MRLAWVGLALGCASSPPEPPEPSQADAVARAEAIAAAEAPTDPVGGPGEPSTAAATAGPVDGLSPAGAPPEGPPPELVFVWHEIGPLYQSFFTHAEVIAQLQQDLQGVARGPVNIHVYYDQKRFVGDIRLQLLPGTLIAAVGGTGRDVHLSQLAPVTTALATYRSSVSARFDVRVASFRVGVEAFQGPRHCVFGIVGTPPPDGKVVSPCVELNGQSRCGEPQPGGMVQFSEPLAKEIRTCLMPRG